MKNLLRPAVYLAALSLTLAQQTTLAKTEIEPSNYAGEENRSIKSLSTEDIEELNNGSGWGLAKVAELNGLPGPLHLLELKNEIGLDHEQTAKIQQVYKQMKAEAISAGQNLIEQERQLEERFQSDIPDAKELKYLLDQLGATRAQLRFIHLSAHLKTPELLTAEQIAKYNQLRGYDSSDPCTNIPEGHPVEMWKKHNGCE